MRRKKNGFTLIELIAVLVILAIIALIATPLVMNIVKKAKDSANKRSVDGYGKSVELAIATYLLDTGDYPTDLNDLTVEYSGNEVNCSVKVLNEDGSIYLSECSVKGTEVKDSSTEDGWYHYGKLKKTEVTYQSYNIGDVVTYNGMEFYVIENSDSKSDRVTMLKAEPLTVDEVNIYGGVGTDNNHVNNYTEPTAVYYQTAYNYNGYGGMAYYSSNSCGYNGSEWVYDGCTTNYSDSEVKYVVDAWAIDKISIRDLIEDKNGYTTRLLTFEELTTNLGYLRENRATYITLNPANTPTFVYDYRYIYCTMSSYDDSTSYVWLVDGDGSVYTGMTYEYNGTMYQNNVSNNSNVVRPVITLLKSAI